MLLLVQSRLSGKFGKYIAPVFSRVLFLHVHTQCQTQRERNPCLYFNLTSSYSLLNTYSVKLREREVEVKAFLLGQRNDTESMLSQARGKLARLHLKAANNVPEKEWQLFLSREDLSIEMDATNKALKECERNISLIKTARISLQRGKDINEMKEMIKKLFKCLNVETNNKKRKIMEDPGKSEDLSLSHQRRKCI